MAADEALPPHAPDNSSVEVKTEDVGHSATDVSAGGVAGGPPPGGNPGGDGDGDDVAVAATEAWVSLSRLCLIT